MPDLQRRLARRLPIALDVTVHDERARSENVSFSGLLVRLKRARHPGELVPVKLVLAGEPPLALLCVVARLTAPDGAGRAGVGLRVYQPRSDEARAWADLVDRIEQAWEAGGRPHL